MHNYPQILANHLDKQSCVALSDSFVSVQGADSKKLLQGQLSCDMEQVDAGKASFGTASTPKGRLYSIFMITEWQEGYLLKVSADMADILVTTLSKYAVFFKCDIAIETDIRCVGLAANTLDTLSLDSSNVIVQQPLQENAELAELWIIKDEIELNELPVEEAWTACRSYFGIPALSKHTNESFVLQQLNLQELGAVSFKKGCYTGQEIIARMKFLGKLKKKMYLIHCDNNDLETLPEDGSSLLDESGKKIGELVSLHSFSYPESSQKGLVGLAVLNIEAASHNPTICPNELHDLIFTCHELSYN